MGGSPRGDMDVQRCNELWMEKGESAWGQEGDWWAEGGRPDDGSTSGGSGLAGSSRKELLQERVSQTKGYLARDYSL